MQKMLKIYFSDKRIWLYIAFAVTLFVYLLSTGVLFNNWYYLLIPPALAPFSEWLIHKYILHVNIGVIKQLKASSQTRYSISQKISIEHGGKTIEAKIISFDKNYITVGTSMAKKIPSLYHFMDDLHYHHHRNPDYTPLIIAPILAVLILFVSSALATFLISGNLYITMSFLLGLVLYYLYYEWMHLGHHVKGYNHLTRYGRMMKKAHQLHHYKNENYWWGITNPIGDLLFGTFKRNDGVVKSETVNTINVDRP